MALFNMAGDEHGDTSMVMTGSMRYMGKRLTAGFQRMERGSAVLGSTVACRLLTQQSAGNGLKSSPHPESQAHMQGIQHKPTRNTTDTLCSQTCHACSGHHACQLHAAAAWPLDTPWQVWQHRGMHRCMGAQSEEPLRGIQIHTPWTWQQQLEKDVVDCAVGVSADEHPASLLKQRLWVYVRKGWWTREEGAVSFDHAQLHVILQNHMRLQ